MAQNDTPQMNTNILAETEGISGIPRQDLLGNAHPLHQPQVQPQAQTFTIPNEPPKQAHLEAPGNPVDSLNQIEHPKEVEPTVSKIASDPVTLDNPDNAELNNFVLQDEAAKQVNSDTAKDVDSDDILKEMNAAIDSGRMQPYNYDKMALSCPLSDYDKLEEIKQREFIANRDRLESVLADMTSPIQSINTAQETYSFANALYIEAIERLGENAHAKLKHSYQGIGDSNAGIPKKFKDKKVVKLSGAEGLVTLTALTSGMRRITLWNSGFTITLRAIPLDILNMFYRECSHSDYEYGKQYGAFYYLYSDLSVTEFIINTLLPIVICGSSYAHWKDSEKLLKAISFQDYHVILWAMACMMHPNGTNVNFICGEDGCGHIETKFTDLSKLRLINTDLINDRMVEHFKISGWISDEMLENFREIRNLNKVLEFSYGEGVAKRTWKAYMKQASLQDYIAVGKDYNTELLKRCSPDDSAEVTQYMMYNYFRPFKAWIDKFEITAGEGEMAQTFIIENDGTPENDRTIYTLLEELQQYYRDFGTMVREYILDTKISHIAYYFPECPACKKTPSYGYHGYIPYDPMQNFFTLAVTKLLLAASTQENSNTSNK